MIDYDQNKEYLHHNYRNVNNLFGWVMSQKLPVGSFKWLQNTSQFNKKFVKNYNQDSNEGYVLEVDVQYPERLDDLHNGLPSLKIMIIEKVLQPICMIKKEYVIHIRNLKQALING